MPAVNVLSVVLPYCLQRTETGAYRFLNRDYKPVGFYRPGIVAYEKFPIAVPLKGMTPAVARKLSHKGSDDLDEIFLYKDGNNPLLDDECMQQYLDKLNLLMQIQTEYTG